MRRCSESIAHCRALPGPGPASLAVPVCIARLSALVFFPVSSCIQGTDFCLFLCNLHGYLHECKECDKSYQARKGKEKKKKRKKCCLVLQLDALSPPACTVAGLGILLLKLMLPRCWLLFQKD